MKHPGSSNISAGAGSKLLADLRQAVPAGHVSIESEELDRYVADTYWKALSARASGAPLGRPDVVVKPRSDEEVAAVVRLANHHRVPVVPWGGGSGTQGASIPTHGGIVIDLTGMDRIVEIDEQSMTVTAEAGVNGKRLEADVNQRGLMLPHYPASAEFATVGGYVAARGSGVLSTRYGKIEDLVVSLRVVTPTGEIVDTLPVPRPRVGPDIAPLFIGSEGSLGGVRHVRLQLAPLPAAPRVEGVALWSVGAGIEAVRKSLQSGLRPSVVRLYDEVATRITLSPVVGSQLPGVATVICFEGDAAVVAAERESMLKVARAHNGDVLDAGLGEIWWDHHYDFYAPPHQPEVPAVWGTIDVVG